MFLALKEMKKDKGRFILIIGIVALISYLVFFLTGLAYGLAKDNTSAVEKWGASKVVLKSGTNSNILSSMMDTDVLKDFDGEHFSPINIARSVAYKNGSESKVNTIDLVLVGLHEDTKAYPKVIEGEKPSKETEVLASISLKEENDLQIGDELVLSMNDREFTVTGFTEEAKFNVAPVIYTDLQMASASMMSYREEAAKDSSQSENKSDESKKPKDSKDTNKEKVDSVSSATPGVPERIAGVLVHGDSDLQTTDDYDVIGIKDFITELPGYLAQVLTFGLMIGFLILISTIVLGVFMFIITMQKKQTFGIMKVQGISNSYIAKSVISQTFLVSVIGIAIGLILTIASEMLLPSTVPFKSNYTFYAIVSALILLISLLGAIFSVRGVTKVDPLEVLD